MDSLGGGNGGLPGTLSDDTVDYLYTGVQCIEERDGSDTVQRQYIWGQYVDELIQYKKLVAPDAGTYYPLTDLLYRSVLLTKSDKTKYEAYDCDAYGNTLIFGGSPRGTWFTDDDANHITDDPKCQFIFTGRRYDPETSNAATQIYFYRARYYHPALGRFISRDPIAYKAGMNLYEYVRSRPLSTVDPSGRFSLFQTIQHVLMIEEARKRECARLDKEMKLLVKSASMWINAIGRHSKTITNLQKELRIRGAIVVGGAVSVAAGFAAHHTIAASAKVIFITPAEISVAFEAATAAIIAMEGVLAYWEVGAFGQIKRNITKAKRRMYDAYKQVWVVARDAARNVKNSQGWCCYGKSREESDKIATANRRAFAIAFERINKNILSMPYFGADVFKKGN